MALILALDQGTTSSRAILFDRQGQVRGAAQRELRQSFPQGGWVEHDPEEIWESQMAVAREVMRQAGVGAGRERGSAGDGAGRVGAVGITNQRETTVVWDRRTGAAVYPAIVWQDRRTAGFCEELKHAGHEAAIQAKTGLVVDAYFSGSKVRWILDHVAGARQRAERGELAFGTVDSWLIWKLTGGVEGGREGGVHVTDPSNASRTMLFSIHTGKWDEELLKIMGVPREMLPEVRASSGVVGETGVLGGKIPIAGVAGDQQAALFGQACFGKGLAKCTYGTGCFLLLNTGTEAVTSRHQLLTTVAWRKGNETSYALEGSVFIGGAVVQWLRDGLGLIKTAGEIETLAASVADSGGVYLVPAFAGLGAPHWDPYARGAIMGLTRATTAGHIARAAVESIAFQVADVLEAMRADAGSEITELRVDGGAARNDALLQFQADLLGGKVVRPKVTETTALGAAYLAGLATGFWKGTDELAALWEVDRVFKPRLSAEEVKRRRARWAEAVRRSRGWCTDDTD